jgi:Tfp pilus assembly PilM family ATPase/Tfp pilus assembly protein PilN
MARPSEITSTQKLLGVIRKKRHGAPAVTDSTETPLKKTGRFKLPSPTIIALHKTSTVGIDISRDYLRLVRVTEKGRGNWQILDRRRLAVPPDTPVDTPEFTAFLKSALGSVCGSPKHSRLWVLMSSARVEMNPITIPKVHSKQLGNVVYWTVKKATPFDEKEMILDFEVQGEVIDQGAPKLAAMAYTAPRQEIDDLKNLFSGIGWPLTGITIASFSLQNLLRTQWVPAFDMTVAGLSIENDSSRIDIYTDGNLVMTREIKAGLNSMTDALVERFNETKSDPDAPPLTSEQGRKIILGLGSDTPLRRETDVGFGLGKEEIFKMIEPALERLARQVERTFEHFNTTKPGGRIDRIFVSGATNIPQSIVDYMGAQLGTASATLDPLIDEESTACPDVDDLHCVSERIAFGTALSLALSDNERTPNLMLTYKDKEREVSIKRINRAVFTAFIATVLICFAIFTYQNYDISKKKETIAGLRAQIAQAGPPVDRDQVMALVAKVKQRSELTRIYADRYLGLALIGELAAQTPAHIRLTDMKVILGPPPAGDAAKREAPKGRGEEITLEGLILGERQVFETSLAAFTMALEASPLFKAVTIQKNSVEPYLKGEALHFILNMKVEEQIHG